nr:MAG TPA: hypothetical protein [Bacteriophage sp.]
MPPPFLQNKSQILYTASGQIKILDKHYIGRYSALVASSNLVLSYE